MTKAERFEQARRAASQLVVQLRERNQEAEGRGAPKIPEEEYRKLEEQLARKLVRG